MQTDAFSRCHPLTNFLFFLGAIGFGVVIQHPVYLIAGCICAGSYYLLLNEKKGIRLILGMVPLFAVLSLVNPLLNTYGVTVLFTVFGKPYTLEALYYGMAIAGILVVMLLWFGCYNLVLTSDKFVCLFGSLIPALSLLLVMVLRLIPNLMRKARQISGARKSIGKGAGEQSTNKEKITDGMQIISALTDWALEGSIVTSDSMRARGYGSAKRTSFQIYKITGRDKLLIGIMAVLAISIISCGGTDVQYTPELIVSPVNYGFAAYCLFLMIPSVLHAAELLQWRKAVSRI